MTSISKENSSSADPSVSAREKGRLFLRHAALTLAVFVPLLFSFITIIDWYPMTYYAMFYGASELGKSSKGRTYFILRGVTSSGQTVDIPPITITDGLDDKNWSMVDAVVDNESFQIRWPHPNNVKLIVTAQGVENLPRAALLPDLMRVWGQRYNARLPVDSPARLVTVRLDAYRWSQQHYADYSEFIESWHVDL